MQSHDIFRKPTLKPSFRQKRKQLTGDIHTEVMIDLHNAREELAEVCRSHLIRRLERLMRNAAKSKKITYSPE